MISETSSGTRKPRRCRNCCTGANRVVGSSTKFVYMKPGTSTMAGDSEQEGCFECVEVPKHEVKITKGFYLGNIATKSEQGCPMG